ncbi:alpha/beta fold hydrolase [Paenibacillus sp. N1-5-1-14]|uniref:alpha/beta fold hydrolase n=1 Tax=Paenibacillus radicibacter TaxID=2972488 RepID=UPI0021595AD1|nr:alpha/beta fold hydrolase [Paenibacillus radicibacter]MCR8641657.1 alpha/beta fold hydrolase [Paenibacillus radicibacter]
MAKYVLIHGAWHGKWCWDKVKPLLTQAGHEVEAIDLPGHGDDQTPLDQMSLATYVDKVVRVLDEASEPVILVGHSMGGVVITQAAEYRPDKIASLVYLSAFMPLDGGSLMGLAMTDRGALVFPNMVMAEDRLSCTIREEALREIFYMDCSEEDYERAASLVGNEATAILEAAVSLSSDNFGRVPKYYIECLKDKALSNDLQKRIIASLPFEQVFVLDTDHSAFFSAPEKLVEHLLLCIPEK